jgi:hypothetical protein
LELCFGHDQNRAICDRRCSFSLSSAAMRASALCARLRQ